MPKPSSGHEQVVLPQARLQSPLWRHRDYLFLWGGQVVSSTGTQVSQLALPLLILALTHSPAQAGIASALRSIPYLMLGFPAGALVDRWNRKWTMILCDLGRLLCMGSIPVALLLGHLTILQLYLISFSEGTFFVFFDLAEVACLPQVISKEQLPAATAQNIATANISALLGSPVGGLLYSIGALFPFLADAISYLCSVLSLLCIRASFQQERPNVTRSLVAEIKEGLLWLWKQRLFRFLAFLLCGINVVAAGSTLIIILLAQHLHASAVDLGLIFSVGGMAGILGSATAPLLCRRLSFYVTAVSVLWPQSLLLLLLGLSPNVFILGMITAVLFFFVPIFDIVQRSRRLALIPDALQGRVNSVYRLIVFSGRPVSLALTGVLLQKTGTTSTVLLVAGSFALMALLATLNPHLRRENAEILKGKQFSRFSLASGQHKKTFPDIK